jgi:hypothetical protein
MMDSNMDYLTAEDLLHGYFELLGLEPSKKSWSEAKLKDNPPRFYRIKMLKALFKAFEAGDIKKLEKGAFVMKRDLKDYDGLIERIVADPVSKDTFRKECPINLRDIAWAFQRLFRYRSILDNALRFNQGVLTASGIYAFAAKKAEWMNRIIHENIPAIDDILCAIISPSNKAFSENEMIERFGYPDIDLSAIDDDWMW